MSLATKVSKATSQGGMAGRVSYGDPGLGSFLGRVAGGIGGFLTGGPAGAIAGAGLLGGGRQQVPRPSLPGINPPFAGPPGVGIGSRKGGTRLSFGEPDVGGPPKGMRLNKTSYFLKDGTFVPEGTRYVKVRRRNSLNPRALSRAMARLEGAKKASKKLSRITIRSKKC